MTWASGAVESLQAAFTTGAVPANAPAMEKYMRGLFPFLGIKAPQRRTLQREALKECGRPASADDLGELAGHLWELPEREYQYAACDILGRYQKLLLPGHLGLLRTLITTKPWWDTVDALATGCVGPLVRRNPELRAAMDAWMLSPDLWVARRAIIHQVGAKAETDTGRLFEYALLRADDKEFFIRKAIGWSLRDYSWRDPDAVALFVAEHEAELSPLTKREAMLVINGGRKNLPGTGLRGG